MWAALILIAAGLLVWPGLAAVGRRRRGPVRQGNGGPARFSRERQCDPLAGVSALDLLAACLRAGLPAATAVRAVSPIAPAPMAHALRRTSELLALGAEAATAWHQASDWDTPPEFAALARLARRSAQSGASFAEAVNELADRRRAVVADLAQSRAERAGVLIGGPLGLCFLPAFVCLGIVPVVLGLAGQVLGDGLW